MEELALCLATLGAVGLAIVAVLNGCSAAGTLLSQKVNLALHWLSFR